MSRARQLADSADLSFDDGTLVVDSANNRVGIGTSPVFRADLKMSSGTREGGLAIRRSTNDNHQLGLWTTAGQMFIDAVTDDPSAAGRVVFRRSLDTGSTFSESMRIDENGNVGIGTSSPSAILETKNATDGSTLAFQATNDNDHEIVRIGAQADGDGYLTVHGQGVSTNVKVQLHSDGDSYFTGGNVGIGTTTPTIDSSLAGLSVNASGTVAQVNNVNGATLKLTDPATGGNRGLGLTLQGTEAAISNCESGSLRFGTGNAERMRIDSSGNVMVGKTVTGLSTAGAAFEAIGAGSFATGSDTPLYLNRQTSDGTLIEFRQANSVEGSISVSGSTVSYNGGHLARWSRLADDSKDSSIVKGTVMTNLDAMVVWSHETTYWTEDDELPVDEDGNATVSVGDVKEEAYTEENEQLNKMAVSSVEGDLNVAGVFINWDDDDDFNDMNIAMTGDMVIRIAQGTTVARGDLLMSAGDGTAKPQGDDIVRSKTIAKVTSINVSHTYDDGSYLVPCVLMAC